MHHARHNEPSPEEVNRRAFRHALPFCTIFDELRVQRNEELSTNVQKVLGGGPATQHLRLAVQIRRSERAYKALESNKNARNYTLEDEQGCLEADRPLLELMHRVQSSALCLSGGGIRSASFSLGILEGLARFGSGKNRPPLPQPSTPALHELDYLSTVSGGGYTGSWLVSWTKRWREVGLSSQDAYQTVVAELAGDSPHTSGDPASRPIRHLREYTSFLAPKLGMGLDTWTLAGLVLRNLIVNWAMIIPLILALVGLLQVLHYGLFSLAPKVAHWGYVPAFVTATVLYIFAGVMAGFRMPSRQTQQLIGARFEPGFVIVVFILPLVISSVILLALWYQTYPVWPAHRLLIVSALTAAAFVSFSAVTVVRNLLSSAGEHPVRKEHSVVRSILAGLAASLVVSFALAVSLDGIGVNAHRWLTTPGSVPATSTSSVTLLKGPDLTVNLHADSTTQVPAKPIPPLITRTGRGANGLVLFGFPVIWACLMIASALFSGFVGIFEEDIDREWWARAGGLMMSVLGFWIVAEAIAMYAPTLQDSVHTLNLTTISTAGLLTGLLGAMGGASTAGGIGATGNKKADVSALGRFLNRFGLIVPTLCALALLALALLISDFEFWLAHLRVRPTSIFGLSGDQLSVLTHLKIFVAAAFIGLIVNWVVNINIFSLHGMYRMRLMRAFLGASNTQRKPDAFTGFDERDTMYETEVPCGPGMPLHLINATVNLVGTKDLAWQQRKAEGFTFSPLSCGGWRLGYVPTKHYGRKNGLSLATAMAISGAAFNPNMGYHSSPLVTLLMTLFNVRLGWWLPNPKYQRGRVQEFFLGKGSRSMVDLMEKKAPRLALRPLITEMLGATDDTSAYIELTDGGHFENLGVYEMVLRRCQRIIIVDAGADPKCQFEDLGNALRKIQIDLGVPIRFHDGLKMQAGSHPDNLYCALADIDYACVDGDCVPTPGKLLYIKASLTGSEPPDILQYAKTHATFPHESTANQFFNESQFESYRHLGSFIIDQIVAQGQERRKFQGHASQDATNLDALFELAGDYVTMPVKRRYTTDEVSELASGFFNKVGSA